MFKNVRPVSTVSLLKLSENVNVVLRFCTCAKYALSTLHSTMEAIESLTTRY